MRCWLFGVLLAMTACGSPKTDQPAGEEPTPIAFDGTDGTDAAARITHGERLTRVLGCSGCHGKDLTGRNFTEDDPQYGPVYASNLTLVVPHYSDAALEKLLRAGEHPDRHSLWIMPSEIFQHLSAPDMAALITYLRTLPPSGKPTPPPAFSAQDKKDIAAGVYKPAAQLVRELKVVLPFDAGLQLALGRYMTSVTCAECHGPKLEGKKGDTPDLVIAGAYSRDEFERLITQGIAKGGRKIKPLMVKVAQTRFAHLTPHERDGLYAYLKARAERPQ
ncbi:c-type cytochrome [Sphingomonas sp.]|uniref:c-type cytochrome n=1 Tax=Sphingomonas sp. TaxID=28214 RepID=UPI00286A9682|nr:c-type cytochrome [Sphingomonas sp.]